MQNLGAVLEAAGTSFQRTVKTLCFLQTMDDFAAFNEVYARYFTEKPARSCVAVRTLPKGGPRRGRGDRGAVRHGLERGKIMYCRSCGCKLEPEARFCRSWGAYPGAAAGSAGCADSDTRTADRTDGTETFRRMGEILLRSACRCVVLCDRSRRICAVPEGRRGDQIGGQRLRLSGGGYAGLSRRAAQRRCRESDLQLCH